MRSDFHFSIYSSPLMMAESTFIRITWVPHAPTDASSRLRGPTPWSMKWAESVQPIPAPHRHPRLGPDAYQRQRSAVTFDMKEGYRRAVECTRWSYGDVV